MDHEGAMLSTPVVMARYCAESKHGDTVTEASATVHGRLCFLAHTV